MEPVLASRGPMALRMRQSVDAFEQAFLQETVADRGRRERLRRAAVRRSRLRRREHERKRSSLRFGLLVLALVATAVGVTVVMFETLYAVMG
jgi:hypothetical protein